MKIQIKDTYHNTIEIVEAKSLEQAKKEREELLQITASNLTPNEIDEDWEAYYKNYDKAYNATYDGILSQLIDEMEYTIIEESGL